MGNIVLLDDLTINKIAAGEVIERPASVVKEMLENSIDAGAKNITVEIKNGGISMIKITDDGIGIAEDDMEIAFERHATSKIRRAEDLARVTSMGFRGEALASIASISRVEMVSKNENESVAHKIIVEGGKTIQFTETARNVGTTITVENLFFNTPVRYKFLKKDYTEAGYIEDVVTRIALVNLDVSLKLISNGKTIIQTNGNGDIKTAIYSIYGKDISMETVEVDYEFEEIRVSGVVGNPVIARSNRSNQLFFLNGRYIKDKNITAAVDQAFKGIVPVGRYGFAILNLHMDPKCVDVNVHPAKLEVRFEDESKVFKAVYHAIKSCLTNVDNTEAQKQDTFNFMNSFYQNKMKDSFKAGNTTPITFNNSKYEYNYAKPVVDNSFNSKFEMKEKNEDSDKKSSGIVGLFKKIIKEPDETEDEINNNYLADIYKSNYGLGEGTEITIKDNLIDNNVLEEKDLNKANDFQTPINSNTLNKSIVLGSTLISSETVELNISNANEISADNNKPINEEVKIDENVLNVENNYNSVVENKSNGDSSDTQEIYINSSEDETQVVEPINKIIEKEDMVPKEDVTEENKLEESELDNSFEKNDNSASDSNIDNAIETSESYIMKNSNNYFDEAATDIINAKMDMDSTQMVDTNKIRQALNENVEESLNEPTPEFEEMYKKTFGIETFSQRKEKELENIEKQKTNMTDDFEYIYSPNLNVFNEDISKIQYRYIGIAFDNFIIVEIKDEIYIINQTTANGRIIYDELHEKYYKNDEKVDENQFLLLPDVINLTDKELILARENENMLSKAGFIFEEFGDKTIKLVAVPSICEKLNTKQLFMDILKELDKVAITAKEEKADKFIATIADKVSKRSNVHLDDEEARIILDKLLLIQNPFEDILGKPVAIKMTRNDLERKFSRR